MLRQEDLKPEASDSTVFEFFERIRRLSDNNGGIEFNKSKLVTLNDGSKTPFYSPFHLSDVSAIYVRDCYAKLFAKIVDLFTIGVPLNSGQMCPVYRVILAGSSGVGKTIFSYIFMSHLINTSQTFLYKPTTSSVQYYFDGSFFISLKFVSYDCKPSYFIIDNQKVEYLPNGSKVLVISGSNKKDYKVLFKTPAIHKLYMPYWKWSEFEDLFAQRPDCYDVKKSQEVFDIYGGVARYVLDKVRYKTVDDLKLEMKMKISDPEITLRLIFSYSFLESDETSTLILHFSVDDEFDSNSVCFPSSFVKSYLADTKGSQFRQIIGLD